MTIPADLHTLSGAYAAHALGEGERRAFEQHLAQCGACAVEVQEFAATLARLAEAEAVVPPTQLKAQVLAAASSIRQLPASTAQPSAGGRLPRPAAQRWPKFALAASVAVAATLGGIALQQHGQAQRTSVQADRLHAQQVDFGALLTQPDARTATAPLAAGSGMGTVVWSPSRGQAGFLAADLPALPQGTTYQLWFNDAGTMRPAGLLPSTDGSVLLTGPIRGAVGIGVTVEPSGGSQHPTGKPVLLLPFS
ncbi:anti-sigma factor [Kitasatospora nipponensis]|uniref:Regulator of SigK n=1 Tax=Kitasatospora nipponensis TaxID=258049 RepID=A0ABP4GIV1_9ACTN